MGVFRGWRAGPLVLALLWLSGCGDDAPTGAPPSISALTLLTTTVPVAVGATVSGTVTFHDDDGDPRQLLGDLVLPDQTTVPVIGTLLDVVAGQTDATLRFAVEVKAPVAGRYSLRLRMIDDQFHPSATLTASFDAQ